MFVVLVYVSTDDKPVAKKAAAGDGGRSVSRMTDLRGTQGARGGTHACTFRRWLTTTGPGRQAQISFHKHEPAGRSDPLLTRDAPATFCTTHLRAPRRPLRYTPRSWCEPGRKLQRISSRKAISESSAENNEIRGKDTRISKRAWLKAIAIDAHRLSLRKTSRPGWALSRSARRRSVFANE